MQIENQPRRGRGRPKGSKSGATPIVNVEPSRCPGCGSTERGEYFGRTEQVFEGVRGDGTRYNLIVRRRCRCGCCGQVRIDRSLEFVANPGQ